MAAFQSQANSMDTTAAVIFSFRGRRAAVREYRCRLEKISEASSCSTQQGSSAPLELDLKEIEASSNVVTYRAKPALCLVACRLPSARMFAV
jgi:hypothetical protein